MHRRELLALGAGMLTSSALTSALPSCAPRRPEAPRPSPSADERVLRVASAAGSLRVSDGGTGEAAVVFVHGLGGDLEVWRAQLDFVRARRRAVAYDQRGHGQSARPADGVYSIDALAADLEAVRRSLGLGRLVLVGHSISGDVVTSYAASHPEKVAGIVYVDAIGDLGSLPREGREEAARRDTGYSLAQWKAEWEEMLGAEAKPTTRRLVLAGLDEVDVRALAALRADMRFFPARERAARYTGPRVAIEVDDPEGAELRASALDRATRLVTVRGVSHWLMLDDPATLNRTLTEALVAMP